MTQLFKPRSTALYRLLLYFIFWGSTAAFLIATAWKWSAYETETDVTLTQPVPFSHKHHVGGMGLDCRYCHSTVETTANAGMPSSHTCMTCHSQIWQSAPMLAPVRNSYARSVPIQWERVHRLPQYVYFNHSIHVNKGVGCTSCHGDVGQMPLIRKVRSFYMRDCLSCHREPELYLRPQTSVFDPNWQVPDNQLEQGLKLLELNHIPKQRLTDCTTCHR